MKIRKEMLKPINGLQFSIFSINFVFLKTFGFKSLILEHLEIFLGIISSVSISHS